MQMLVNIKGDRLDDGFSGLITTRVPSDQILKLYIPEDLDSGLPHIGIYDKKNEFIRGIVVPPNYNAITVGVIDDDN